jgi:hypothetical protein
LYYTPIAFFISIIVGVIVSGITGWQKPQELEPALLAPIIRRKIFDTKKVCSFLCENSMILILNLQVLQLETVTEKDSN